MKKQASRWQRWRNTVINLGTILCLLLAVSFLPADTSLSHIRERGVLKLCVPEAYPPLVTGDPNRPGYDVELAQGIAQHLGVRLMVNTLPTIGRDFNPRNWMVTRGQCDMLGGGVADTVQTRNFMQTLPTDIKLGWMMISPDGKLPVSGNNIVIIPGSSGLDRLQLSAFLRRNGLRPIPAQPDVSALQAIKNGQAKALIAENFTACNLLKSARSTQFTTTAITPASKPLKATWLAFSAPETPSPVIGLPVIGLPAMAQKVQTSEPSYSMALTLWKGDLTLKRAVEEAMQKMARNSTTQHLRDIYLADTDDCADLVADN